jgi:hypothetical protein
MKALKTLTISILFCSCFSKLPEKTGLEGEPMPIFKILLPDSTTYLNTKEYAIGKPVVMIYFGPRCPYSRALIQEIVTEIEKLKDIQFLIFATAPFYQMKWFYEEYKLAKYPNIHTGVDYTNTFIDYFKIHSVPYVAIYGSDKKLKYAFEGQVPASIIKKLVTN